MSKHRPVRPPRRVHVDRQERRWYSDEAGFRLRKLKKAILRGEFTPESVVAEITEIGRLEGESQWAADPEHRWSILSDLRSQVADTFAERGESDALDDAVRRLLSA